MARTGDQAGEGEVPEAPQSRGRAWRWTGQLWYGPPVIVHSGLLLFRLISNHLFVTYISPPSAPLRVIMLPLVKVLCELRLWVPVRFETSLLVLSQLQLVPLGTWTDGLR